MSPAFPVCGPGSLSRRGVPGNNLGTYDACPDPREYRPRRQVNALEPHGGPACHAMQIESDAPEECPLCADGIELVQTCAFSLAAQRREYSIQRRSGISYFSSLSVPSGPAESVSG